MKNLDYKEWQEKRKKFGYKEFNTQDYTGLTEDFNKYIEKIYDNILFYLDEITLEVIYPIIYNHLNAILEEAINAANDYGDFSIVFHAEAEKIVRKVIKDFNIDFLSSDHILSKLKVNTIELCIIIKFIPTLIADNINSRTASYPRNYICAKFNITSTQYNIELLKALKELIKLHIKKEKSKIRL